MNKLDHETVQHVAKLARLHIDESDAGVLASQLVRILKFMDQLNELDTDGVAPTSHPFPAQNVLRDDVVASSLEPGAALEMAPDKQDQHFRVPKVLDQDGV